MIKLCPKYVVYGDSCVTCFSGGVLFNELICVCAGIQLRLKNSPEKICSSFTYTSLPGVQPAPIEWKMCCDPDAEVGGEHVTYHMLKAEDDNLSTVVEYHIESNIVGLIIINHINSLSLSNDLVTRYVAPSPPMPLYIVSSRDGKQLKELVEGHEEGLVQIKVSVESAVDTAPVSSRIMHHTLSSECVHAHVCVCV